MSGFLRGVYAFTFTKQDEHFRTKKLREKTSTLSLQLQIILGQFFCFLLSV